MFDFDDLCPYCEEKITLNRIGLKAREFILCPHCRKVIKLDLVHPVREAIHVDRDFAE